MNDRAAPPCVHAVAASSSVRQASFRPVPLPRGTPMKAIAAVLLAAALPASAHDAAVDPHHERTISTASQLAPWCRAEAEARVVAQGATPYQWTASYHDRVN